MQINQIIEKYINYSRICEKINYQDKLSIKKSNESIAKMYQLVKRASDLGTDALLELTKLLDDPVASKWLAHQLVEKTDISSEITRKCFSIVQKLALGDDIIASGEKMWLAEWGEKKRMTGHMRSKTN